MDECPYFLGFKPVVATGVFGRVVFGFILLFIDFVELVHFANGSSEFHDLFVSRFILSFLQIFDHFIFKD